MKALKNWLIVTAMLIPFGGSAYDWKTQSITIQRRWAKDVSPTNSLKEYPRPQMLHEKWTNLNGLTSFRIFDLLRVKHET